MRKFFDRILHIILIFLLIIAIFTAIFLFYLQSRMGKLERNRSITAGNFPQTDFYSVLLIGSDRREGEETSRSDAMILLCVNRDGETVTMISFLRDLYVEIPGHGGDRLNAAYAIGGAELLDETLQANFGVAVDANVVVDFAGFRQVIDALGGVEITLTPEEADYMTEYLDGEFCEGMQSLNGEQALFYARIRYLDSDFYRTARQRNVLLAAAKRCRELPLTALPGLVHETLPYFASDLSATELAWEAARMFPILTSGEVKELRIPADGTCYDATIDGMAVLVADLDANREAIRTVLYGD